MRKRRGDCNRSRTSIPKQRKEPVGKRLFSVQRSKTDLKQATKRYTGTDRERTRNRIKHRRD